MGDSDSDNVFNLAGKSSGKKKPADTPSSPLQAPHPQRAMSQEELQRLQEQVLKWKKDLQEGLDKVYKVAGFSGDSLGAYLDNPANFKQDEWLTVQELRRMKKVELNEMLGEEITEGAETQRRSKDQKKIKGKSLGARRKWIDMR